MTAPRDPYLAFLEAKAPRAAESGFDVAACEVNPALAPHCRAIVPWALKGGRRAIFAAFGLHKTSIQIEMMRLVVKHAGGPCLIVVPLGVRHEFFAEAEARFTGEHAVALRFIRRSEEVSDHATVYLTNYESVRDGKIDPSIFTAVSLDEAAVLRSYGSKTYQTFLPLFRDVRFRFVATATPSPNRTKELIHYAGFLGVMDTGQALTRFFQRNSEKAGDLTLFPHKEDEFWLWCHSWAIFLQRPSDLGFADDGYLLPAVTVNWHEVAIDHSTAGFDRQGQGLLIRNTALGVSEAASAKRDSLPARIAKMSDLIAEDPEAHRILWHDLEAERLAIQKAVPEARAIFGSQSLEINERHAIDFKEGRFRDLATKPEMSGAGCNFQAHCAWAIFLGVGFKFHDFIQALHRIVRFGQGRPCRIDIIYSEAEREVRRNLEHKWAEHEELMARMAEIIRRYGLGDLPLQEVLQRSIGVERQEARGELYDVALNDAVAEARRRPEASIGLLVTSIPFANHYEYTASYNDFGHTDDNGHFWAQMDHLTPELARLLMPGRLACIHVKDRILFGAVTGQGVPTVSPFHAEAIFHYLRHGLQYLGMITVVTDVVRENNQTYRLGYTEMCKDGTKMGAGSPEYILLFRQPQSDLSKGYADLPVTKDPQVYSLARWQVDAHAFWRSSGDRLLSPEELAALGADKLAKFFAAWSLQGPYDYEAHVGLGEAIEAKRPGALPRTFMALAPGSHDVGVWHDVNRMRTLNGDQQQRNLEKHVCLARGSLVLTWDGYRPIEELEVGDLVLTHKGRWRAVTAKACMGVRPVVTTKAQGVPGLTTTPDHELWARGARTSHPRRWMMNGEPAWTPAVDTLGSYVNLKLPPVQRSLFSADEWWAVGRWLGDGHWDVRGRLHISCANREANDLIRRLGSLAGSAAQRRTGVQIAINDRSGRLRSVLKRCGRGAAGKTVPGEALSLPPHLAEALLSGYLSADGHKDALGRWSASTVSKALALGMAVVAQRARGVVASVYRGRPAGRYVIENRSGPSRCEWIILISPRNRSAAILGDGAWKKVRSVAPSGEVEVWDISVADDASFTAEGCVVKNCPLQFDIVDRLIERYSNKGDLVYDPFGGLMTVPYRAILKGRRGAASELNQNYFRDGVRYLREAEAGRLAPSLFDLLDDPKEGEAAE